MSTTESWAIDPDLDLEDFSASLPLKKVPTGNLFEASRAGDVDRLRYLLDSTVNVNATDQWDSTALYYACLAGHLEAVRMLLESGAICSEHTFDGDRCHYASLNFMVRKLLKAFEARPPPLKPLQAALRQTFLGCSANGAYHELFNSDFSGLSNERPERLPSDVVFYVQGRPIEAHRVILSARSPFFKKKFETDWKDCVEVRFSREKLSYSALYSLIHFFYSDRLEIAVDDMESLVRICKVCKCEALERVLKKELIHQKYAEYKALGDVDNSRKRFILQGLSLPEEDRLPASLRHILESSLAKSLCQNLYNISNNLASCVDADDLADVCIRVDKKMFRCHQVVIASRSEYFRARLFHMKDFFEQNDGVLPCFVEHHLSMEAFEAIIEYMYTDGLKDINPDLAEEMFDAASRFLLFPLKRVVADAMLPHLERVPPSELCHWLMLSDIYGVVKTREYCLEVISCKFETFAETPEFRAMISLLPPPAGDSSLRTTTPNLLDDLREKWLHVNGREHEERDESALWFDRRLQMLMLMPEE